MNHVVLVGRLTENPEITKMESGKSVMNINVAVSRNYKNSDGVYESDFIRCVLWDGIAESTSQYCNLGDVIGVKGRLQSRFYEDESKKRVYITEVVAEKVTFLSSNKNKEIKDEGSKEVSSKKAKKNS